ncbi:hypothetical protein [Seinonella peptonophila]|nr:hypothetical protein [Seinonella peptonophila]
MTLLFSLLMPHSAFAAPAEETTKQIEELKQDIQQLKANDEVYKDIREEIKNYNDFMQQKNTDLSSTFNLFITMITFLFTVIGAGFFYFAGQSKKETKEELARELAQSKEESERALKKAQIEIQTSFETQLQEMRTKTEQEFKKILDWEFNTFKQMINNEIVFKSTRILLVAPEEETKRMEREELMSIRQRGIDQIEPMEFDLVSLKTKLESENYDILIYRFLDDVSTPDATKIVDLLINGKYEIPYIVYNDPNHWFQKDVKQKLISYHWYTFANHPITLVSYLFSLAYAYNKNQPVSRRSILFSEDKHE